MRSGGRGAAVVGGYEEDSLGANGSAEDETPVVCERSSETRASILRARSRYATKYTLHVYAKRSGVLHWDLSDRNADTKEIARVAIDAVGAMKSGETVIWDRLGRSGRAVQSEQPALQPGGERSIRGVACRSSFLPPKGKYFNPLEPLSMTSNNMTSDRIFRKTVDRCPSQRLQGLFEGM